MKRLACLLLFTAVSVVAHASGKHGHEHGHEADSRIGSPGEAKDVTRTVEVLLYDNYYEPESITVVANETIRFVIKNAGVLVHEFNIGTAEMHAAHKDEMMMMMRHGVLFPDRIDRAKNGSRRRRRTFHETRRPQQCFVGTGRRGRNRLGFCKSR